MRSLLSAFSFLTVLPVPGCVHRDRAAAASSAGFFPLVGLVIGLIMFGFARSGAADLVAVVAALALPFVLTRALHADGLADTLDGLLGGSSPAERARIMHDSRVGAFGVAGISLDVTVRAILLVAVVREAPAALIVFPVLGRWAMALALAAAPYGRKGKMAAAAPRPGAGGIAAASLWVAALFPLLPGTAAPLAVSVSVALALTFLWVFIVKSMLGRVSGDALGALNEFVEIATLAVFAQYFS